MHNTCIAFLSFTSSFAHSVTSPSFAYMCNPAPDSSLCRAVAPRLCPLQLLLPDCIDPLQLLLPDCIDPLQLLLPDCVRFMRSAAARRLRLLQLLLPDFNCSPISTAPRLCPFRLLFPDRVRFGCCSPIVSASAAVPR